MGFFGQMRFVCFIYIFVLISLGLVGSIYVKDEKASWLIPLLIAISLLFLVGALAFLIKKKIDSNREEIEKPPPEVVYDEAGEKENKPTMNPVFEEVEKVVYLPSDAAVLADMKVIAVERFQGEVLPWPGDDDGKEEICAEFVLDDEVESENETVSLSELSFQNQAYEEEEIEIEEEPVYDEVENFQPFTQIVDGEKIYVDVTDDLRASDLQTQKIFPWINRTKFEKVRQTFSPKPLLRRVTMKEIKLNALYHQERKQSLP